MLAGQLRIVSSGTPVIARETTARISGVVLSGEATASGGVRYLLRPLTIEGLAKEGMPALIRVSAQKGGPVAAGMTISGLARLQPFPGPAYPGGFDFGFHNWLEGRGGAGFFLGAPIAGSPAQDLSLAEKLRVGINSLRSAMSARIRAAAGGEPGDVAAALITGERLAVDDETEESFRRSGLTHILSISGLHMALVTLALIAGVRFALSLFPAVVLYFPLRKAAAMAALVSATFYLLLSGADVPTQRSYIMIVIMLLAMLADRRAVTMRNVALAAMIVLAFTPEAVLEPGFQMSFAATAALVAGASSFAEWRGGKLSATAAKPAPQGILRRLAFHVASLAATSLVAGIATGIFAAYHFHRIAPMSVPANLMAAPVVSLAVMPLALAGVVLMPFGLEWLALKPMAYSIELLFEISETVNALPVAEETGMQHFLLLPIGVTGLLLLTALRTKLRLAGIPVLAAIFFLPPAAKPPDIIIAQNGRSIAVKNQTGDLALLYPDRDRFTGDIWRRAWPTRAKEPRVATDRCDNEACDVRAARDVRAAFVYDPGLLQQYCETADILVAPRLRWLDCRDRRPALVLLRGDLEKFGTHAIRISGTRSAPRFAVETAIHHDGRPWNSARMPPPLPGEVKPAPVNSAGSDPQADLEPLPGLD
jgi:competence protein ComEC